MDNIFTTLINQAAAILIALWAGKSVWDYFKSRSSDKTTDRLDARAKDYDRQRELDEQWRGLVVGIERRLADTEQALIKERELRLNEVRDERDRRRNEVSRLEREISKLQAEYGLKIDAVQDMLRERERELDQVKKENQELKEENSRLSDRVLYLEQRIGDTGPLKERK